MVTRKMLVLFIILVATDVLASSDNKLQNDVSKFETMNHEPVYSRVKRQFGNYPNGYGNGRRNTPIPIMFGGGGFGGRNYGGRGYGGSGFGGRGFGAGRGGGFGGGRGRG